MKMEWLLNTYGKRKLLFSLILCNLFFLQTIAYAEKFQKTGNVVVYNGNKFELYDDPIQPGHTTILKNSEGQYIEVPFKKIPDSFPVTINGAKIYNSSEVKTEPILLGNDENLDSYLFNNLKDDISQLDNSDYWKLYIEHVVIDEKGNIVYFKYVGMTNYEVDNKGRFVWQSNYEQRELINKIEETTYKLLENGPKFKPALLYDGTPVPYLIEYLFAPRKMISVKNHVAEIH